MQGSLFDAPPPVKRAVKVQPTSAVAYREITEEGLINDAQKAVLSALREFGPMTGTEVDTACKTPSAHKRCSELERMGLVKSNGTRRCSLTGRTSKEWMVR